MSDLKYWQDKIKEKRKNTNFRDFIKEIASFRTLAFYKNNSYVSIFPETDRVYSLISHSEFSENRDNLTKSWIVYDFSLDFFSNFKKLNDSIKLPPTILFWECENSDFTDQSVNVKNSYLSYIVIKDCENIFYSMSVKVNSRNVFNSLMVWDNCENIYFWSWIINSSNIFYSCYVIDSYNLYFCSNLIWCKNCIFCNDLENKSYCINNIEYSKDEFNLKKRELLNDKSKFTSYYEELIRKNKWINIGWNNVKWSFNIRCENVENAYFNREISNSRNVFLVWWRDSWERIYDCFANTPNETDFYWTFSAWFWDNVYNSYHVSDSSNIYYSCIIEWCSYCIWCIWLKNKSYCILNKQYSKEDWENIAENIFSQMDNDKILWNFFPWWLNPFYFNDTMAWILGDFTKEEVESEGYMWREWEIKVDIPKWAEVVNMNPPQSPFSKGGSRNGAETGGFLDDFQWYNDDWKRYIKPEILKKVIKDKKWNYYRIVKMEYDFLVKHWLPLPELHWQNRIKLNFWL